MDMTSCVFCGKDAANASVEHVLPESLGGDEHLCLPDGLVCSACNQYFGSKVEQLALSSHPFVSWRLMMGVPSKKKKPARVRTVWGEFVGSPGPGLLGAIGRTPEFDVKLQRGDITVGRIPAWVTEPEAICQLLLKMAMEVVAEHDPAEARSQRFDALRDAARRPKSGTSWWFVLHVDSAAHFERFKTGITNQAWVDGVYLETILDQGVELFHLSLLDFHLFTPIEQGVPPPDMVGMPPPDTQLIVVNFGPKNRRG